MRLSNFGSSVFSVLLLAVRLLREWKFVAGPCGCASPAEPALMATYVTSPATCLIKEVVRSITKGHVTNMVAPEDAQRLHMTPYGMAEDG